MSWGGLKKATNRMGTTLMQKTGYVERTVDREFAEEEGRYRTMEKETNNLQKDSKTYLDAMRAMASSQTRIAETVGLFYSTDSSSDGAMTGHAYKAAVDEMDIGVARDLDAPYRATVLEPIGKLNNYYSTINSAIDKRNHKVGCRPNLYTPTMNLYRRFGVKPGLTILYQMLDYDSSRAKVKKLVEKPADDTTKLPRAQAEHDEARDIFNILNEQLITELPMLLDLRVPYLDPSFEAMIRCQLRFAEEGYEKLSGVQRYFADHIRDDYANGALDGQVEGVLDEMKELSIFGP
ncbi:MAG: hypothetical protein TREMPRED_000341 [Tremellales sp. Tagirdzhanova-0007]|nr:MAG: hypothetical protein TREMPRED_000341 [Tremellales sp. Tagirdzhanova-0007]